MATIISSSWNDTSLKATPSESNTLRDVSFSSYLNGPEEDYIRTLAQSALNLRISSKQPKKNRAKDGEIDIFGAERYFNETSQGNLIPNKHQLQNQKQNHQNQNQRNNLTQTSMIKPGTPSCHSSESSWNSQSALLRQRAPPRRSSSSNNKNSMNKSQGIRKLFLHCYYNCCNRNSIVIDKHRVVTASDNNNNNMVYWDAIPSRLANDDQVDNRFSDTSSDLFELDCQLASYAPSEVSIDWSVVTADFEELDQKPQVPPKKCKPRDLLLGCMSQKAVRVAGDQKPKKNKKKYSEEFGGQKQRQEHVVLSSPRWSHSSHASELFYIH